MNKFFRLLLPAFLFPALLIAQVTVSSGPMPGYAMLNEIGIWVQLTGEAEVVMNYWPEGKPEMMESTSPYFSDMNQSNIAKFRLTDLMPGMRYQYMLMIDKDTFHTEDPLFVKTQDLWQFRSDPPAFKVALGSCTYINETEVDRPGEAYGSNYGIFDQIVSKQPDAMLWLGDNIYLREYDYLTYNGYIHRYTHTRSTPQMQRLLQSTHHYAIWDDHDFGPNDANGSWIHKDWALSAFELFWMNPSYGIPGMKGTTTSFPINDIDFFLLDNRYNRTSDDIKSQEPQILGRQQIDWLIENLKFSKAPFKIIAVGGQVLNPARVYENHAQYEKEREYMINRILEEKIKGVVFVTGDRHRTEMRKIDIDGVVIHDLTVSPLTSQVYEAKNESTLNLLPNTTVTKHNFSVLEFTGERLARQLKISTFDKDGAEIWSKVIQP